MRNKYHATKIEVDGIVFDSIKEGMMYKQLKLMEEAGAISSLEIQPKFELQPKFKTEDGRTVRAITYTADFRFFDKEFGRDRVIDCKGFRTEVYKLKKKMFEYKMRNYGIIIEEEI